MVKSTPAIISPHGKTRKIFTTRTPLRGVISAITPFNHPLNMVSHKLAPAIATNNRVVLQADRTDPADRAAAGRHALRGRLAAGDAFGRDRQSRRHGRRHDHRSRLRPRSPSPAAVKVGKYIAEKAGYRRMVLELGGNDPLIVMEDADLDKAAELAVPAPPKTPASAARRSSASWWWKRSRTNSSTPCWSKRRASSSPAIRWTRPPIWAR